MKKKNEEKYTQIIQVTSNLIATQGAALVSTTKVAKLVGISQSNIYIYFKNKDDLLYHVYLSKLTGMQHFFMTLENSSLTLTQQLKAYIMNLYQFALQHPQDIEVIEQIKAMPNSPLHSSELNVTDDTQLARNLVVKGIDAGILRPVSPELHLTIVFNVIRRYTTSIAKPNEDKSAFQPVFAMIWDAIAKPD
ncbi:TetR/AcrR family transcriptional regulator [Pediococcus ethanolidurans]|uniref:Transcription regulator n=1 Tax=Pediococcus ethanolidurans TaxID=319653 RepID=A0A0R2K7X5_9LACO|nr:TetR/AcrR family transcriptional regulator [Pediococcus ethanolidurans]KRN83308.1 transcription regulator [Pediococcus ethanolidurans]GEN94553.1 TetR family transcriptional regulator [Pediococcus ethanolidurans]SER29277.1 transcriptional regulator, TetR family [Pediococcus ethanolidurans]